MYYPLVTKPIKFKEQNINKENEIKNILMEMGLSLGMKIEGFDPSQLRNKDN